MALKQGYIHVYTGNGKGKTTAALGLALRAAGQGLSVTMIQFLKGETDIGEIKAASAFLPKFVIKPAGQKGFIFQREISTEDKERAAGAMELASKIVHEGSTDVLILDEVNVAVTLGLVPEEWLVSVMESKPQDMELVLTGRNASPRIIACADLVTEMREIKHYFKKGVKAREGIEK
ncbi:MAG: cob(I)yrinic acid a,c-diamide adenosyltransferase [Thermodesulfobacteriota bacterium]|nr:cob(I)yrinic acid a,c-diamide adenosyltransferase [Thermodesulfobacteriota bacterium]